jgi:putative flippase GtrA
LSSLEALWERLSAPVVWKFLRYASVSVISTVVSLTILGTLVATRATTAGWANVIATGVATIPSFELNRRWVWAREGRRSISSEVGPFVVWCFAELGLSTLAVSRAVRWADHSAMGSGTRTLVALGANVTTFGILWLAQFLILDRVLFRAREPVGSQS